MAKEKREHYSYRRGEADPSLTSPPRDLRCTSTKQKLGIRQQGGDVSDISFDEDGQPDRFR
jgi:hypothetical protein